MIPYSTLLEARRAVESAVRDARGDYPDVSREDLEHDMVIVVAHECIDTVAVVLLRTELGWDPEGDAELFERFRKGYL